VPEQNFWTLWCKGRLTETDTQTIRLCATPSGLTSAHLHHNPIFLQAGCPSCRPTNSVKALKASQTSKNLCLLVQHDSRGKCNCEIFHWDICAVNNICKICKHRLLHSRASGKCFSWLTIRLFYAFNFAAAVGFTRCQVTHDCRLQHDTQKTLSVKYFG